MLRHLSALLSACLFLLLTATAFAGRDGTATYTAPTNSFNPAVTGQPIDPTDWNAVLDDIEAALTESLYTDDTSSTDHCLVRADGTNGRKVQGSGVCVDDSNNVTGVAGASFSNGAAITTGTTAADTLIFQAYDNDTGPGYITFGTLTAGNSPSFELDNTTLDAAIAKGTWTASGTWTIPDVTFGGTLAWNGQSASGTLADLGTVTTADINGGSIDGTTIGAAVAAAGTFTTGTIATLNGVSTIDATTESTIESAIDALPNAVGVTVQAWGAGLDDLAGLTPTKGHVMVGNGTDWVAVGVGTNGQVFSANSAEASGVEWANAGAGDLLALNNLDDVVNKDTARNNLNAARVLAGVPQGRLTLESGMPVSTSDQTAKTTIYYTPYTGNQIALYDGTSDWEVLTFTELSLSIAGYAADTNFDVWVYNNSGTATLETTAWTNNTTRATGLVRQNGVLVKSGATTRRYVGTFRTTGTIGQTEFSFGGIAANGSAAKLFVWNFYNQVRVVAQVGDSTNSWTLAAASIRAANGSNSMRVSYVTGKPHSYFSGQYGVTALAGSGGIAAAGVGFDSTTVMSGAKGWTTSETNQAPLIGSHSANEQGFHYFQAMEASQTAGTATFYGDANSPTYSQNLLTVEGLM